MSNQQPFHSKQVQSAAPQSPAPMRALTTRELAEVVGGPIIHNGDAIVAVPPVATGA